MLVAGAKGGLPLVTFLDTYSMVGVAEVDFREYYRAVEAVENLVNEREGVLVLDSNGVKASIVDVEA